MHLTHKTVSNFFPFNAVNAILVVNECQFVGKDTMRSRNDFNAWCQERNSETQYFSPNTLANPERDSKRETE